MITDVNNIPWEELPNPNFNNRPSAPDGIVIHAAGYQIKDENGKVWFGPNYIKEHGYSYHALVDHSGKAYVTVDRDKRAWHAGVSRFGDQTGLNNTFIGFCLLVKHDPLGYGNFLNAIKEINSYTDDHYFTLAHLCAVAMKDYPDIQPERIIRHSEVSGPDVRDDPKYDPGEGFSMTRLKSKIYRNINGTNHS